MGEDFGENFGISACTLDIFTHAELANLTLTYPRMAGVTSKVIPRIAIIVTGFSSIDTGELLRLIELSRPVGAAILDAPGLTVGNQSIDNALSGLRQ